MTTEIFRPLSPSMLADPYPVYALLRYEDPVHWHEQLGAWIITRHADCLRTLRDVEVFTSDLRKVGQQMVSSRLSLQTVDLPEHAAIRQPIVAALKSVDLLAWNAQVRRVADRALGRIGTGTFDVVTGLMEPLALAAMCLLYGVPLPADEEGFRAASRGLVLSMDAGLDPTRADGGLSARDMLNGLVNGWFAADGGSGLLTEVNRLAGGVDRQQVINSMRAIFHAGYASTSSLLSNALYALALHDALDVEMLANVDGRLVEELTRFDGPVQAESRGCVSDVALGGRSLRRGAVVVPVLGAANHDPVVFADPGRLDRQRQPNPHLGFGSGIHSCLGAHLARRVAVTVFQAMAVRFSQVRLLAGSAVQRPSATLRGLDALWLDVVVPDRHPDRAVAGRESRE